MPGNVYKDQKRQGKTGICSRIRRIVLRWAQITGFGLLLFGASWGLVSGYQWLINTPLLAIEDVRVSGNHHFDDARIMELAGINRGRNILRLKIELAKTRLARNPWIDSVLIRRELPHTLQITVREREAVYWIQHKGTVCYADKAGRRIAPVRAEDFLSLPLLVVDGSSHEQRKLDVLYRFFLRKRMPFSLAESSWLRFLASGELVEFFLRDRQLRVVISTRGLSANIDCLQRIWQDLAFRGELGQTVKISVARDAGWVKKENQV